MHLSLELTFKAFRLLLLIFSQHANDVSSLTFDFFDIKNNDAIQTYSTWKQENIALFNLNSSESINCTEYELYYTAYCRKSSTLQLNISEVDCPQKHSFGSSQIKITLNNETNVLNSSGILCGNSSSFERIHIFVFHQLQLENKIIVPYEPEWNLNVMFLRDTNYTYANCSEGLLTALCRTPLFAQIRKTNYLIGLGFVVFAFLCFFVWYIIKMKKRWHRKRRGNNNPIADEDFSSTSVFVNKSETPSFEQFLPDGEETVFMENQLYTSSESMHSRNEDLQAHIKEFYHNHKSVGPENSVERRSLNIVSSNKELYRNGQSIIPQNEIQSVYDSVEIRNTSIARKSPASISCIPQIFGVHTNDDDNTVQGSGIEIYAADSSSRAVSNLKRTSYPNLQTDRKNSFSKKNRSSVIWQRFKSKIDIFKISKHYGEGNQNGGNKKDKTWPLNNGQTVWKELFLCDKNAIRNNKITSVECDTRNSNSNKENMHHQKRKVILSEPINEVPTSQCWNHEQHFSVDKKNKNTMDEDEFVDNVYDDLEEIMPEKNETFLQNENKVSNVFQPCVKTKNILIVPKESRSCFDEDEMTKNPLYEDTKEVILGAKKTFLDAKNKDYCSSQWRIALENNLSSRTEFRRNFDEDEFEDNPLYDNPEEIRNESNKSFLDPEVNVNFPSHRRVSLDNNLSPRKENTCNVDKEEFEDNPLYDNPEEIRNESNTSFLDPEVNVNFPSHRCVSLDNNLSPRKENTCNDDKEEFEDNPLYDNPEEIRNESNKSFLDPEVNVNFPSHRRVSLDNNLSPRKENTCNVDKEEFEDNPLYDNPEEIIF